MSLFGKLLGTKSSQLDIDDIINRLKNHKGHQPSALLAAKKNALSAEEIYVLMKKLRDVLQNQPTLVEINPPIKVYTILYCFLMDSMLFFNFFF